MTGQTISRYQVLSELGGGGMVWCIRPRTRDSTGSSRSSAYLTRFLNARKDVDPDIPVLKQGKAEYASCNESLPSGPSGSGIQDLLCRVSLQP